MSFAFEASSIQPKPVHAWVWNRVMNDPRTDTIPLFDDVSQKEFERRCIDFISKDISDVVSILFWGGCIIGKIAYPVAREVVAYAHWYVNNPDMHSLCDMKRGEYLKFKHRIGRKIKQTNQPTIANWQLVFGKNCPFHVTTYELINYYKKIKKMIACGVTMPRDIMTDVEQIDVEQMELEYRQEFMRL
jgi:hypothetical protein